MAKVLVTESALEDIADAIRGKNGLQTTYKPGEMATAIGAIPTPTGTKQITANGTGIDVAQYASADVAVPNTYAAADEGKVVSNGALVAQGSDTVTQNGTVDTTLIKSLLVNVSGGGSGMTSGTYTPTARPTADVPFSCPGATHFLIVVADDQTIDMTTGVAFLSLLYATTSKTSSIGSNNGGTTNGSGNFGYATGSNSVYYPGIRFTSGGVELIYYNHNSYKWLQANLTYNWYAW